MYKPAILLLTALVGLIGCDDAPSRPATAPPPQQGAARGGMWHEHSSQNT